MKPKLYVYFSTYGSHKHDVLVIQNGGEPYDTRNNHVMLDPHAKEFGRDLFEYITPMLENYEVLWLPNRA
jgi:predicted transcriptional regulator